MQPFLLHTCNQFVVVWNWWVPKCCFKAKAQSQTFFPLNSDFSKMIKEASGETGNLSHGCSKKWCEHLKSGNMKTETDECSVFSSIHISSESVISCKKSDGRHVHITVSNNWHLLQWIVLLRKGRGEICDYYDYFNLVNLLLLTCCLRLYMWGWWVNGLWSIKNGSLSLLLHWAILSLFWEKSPTGYKYTALYFPFFH